MSKLLKSGTAGGRLQRSNIRKMGTGGTGISSRRKKMRRGTYLSPFGRIKVSQNQYPVNDGGYCMNFDDGDGWNEYDCTCPGDGYCNCISTGNNCQPCHGGYSGACPSAPIT